MSVTAARLSPPTTGTIVQFIGTQIDADLQFYPGDQAKYERLSKLYNIWTQRRAQFVNAAARDVPLPRLFYYGPHLGWMDAADFLIVLCDIDQRKDRLERVPA